jgi:DNA-binding NarL/FixJ family response regulator
MNTTILLLVSDPIVRSILKETLEREGYTVVAAGDLGQAVDRIKECPPDLLITRTYIGQLYICLIQTPMVRWKSARVRHEWIGAILLARRLLGASLDCAPSRL